MTTKFYFRCPHNILAISKLQKQKNKLFWSKISSFCYYISNFASQPNRI